MGEQFICGPQSKWVLSSPSPNWFIIRQHGTLYSHRGCVSVELLLNNFLYLVQNMGGSIDVFLGELLD